MGSIPDGSSFRFFGLPLQLHSYRVVCVRECALSVADWLSDQIQDPDPDDPFFSFLPFLHTFRRITVFRSVR